MSKKYFSIKSLFVVITMLILLVQLSITFAEEQSHKFNLVIFETKNDGFQIKDKIKPGDPHDKFVLGNFYISGFSGKTKDKEDNITVFLKNVGDKVRFYYVLEQNIDAINGDKDWVIDDENNYDVDCHREKFQMGQGCLFVKAWDYKNNIKITPKANFLKQIGFPNKDTTIELYEEGDYFFKLDYTLRRKMLFNAGLCDEYAVWGRFKVRNADTILYPIDAKTGAELASGFSTENGFRIDLAKSRYLLNTIKREVLNQTNNGLVEDTRFNRIVDEDVVYNEEGIYTIEARNRYTDASTTKKIYVGKQPILKAHVRTGKPIVEIQELVYKGAKIKEDGSIVLPPPPQPKEDLKLPQNTSETKKEKNKASDGDFVIEISEDTLMGVAVGAGVVVIMGLVGVLIYMLKQKKE